MHIAAPAFAHTSGPHKAKIAIVGEAWADQDALVKRPFQGYAGQELTMLLRQAGMERKDCFLTNVFAFQPPQKDIARLCAKKAECGKDYPFEHLGKKGQYLSPQYFPEIQRLREELESVEPNIVIALGAVACWALLGTNGLRSLRGTVAVSSLTGQKVIPSYHPSTIFRSWQYRPILLADLMKAQRESEFPEIRRQERLVLADPTIAEIWDWIGANFNPQSAKEFYCACDIETKGGLIEMIGFSASPTNAMVVPFYDKAKGGNFWPSLELEKDARAAVAHLLHSSSIVKIFQNGLYDLQYLVKEGYRPKNCREDTMLFHHALYPEMEKSLGFLGSIYCAEPAWKNMRAHNKTTFKKDE